MKLTLSNDSTLILKAVAAKASALNPFIQKGASLVVSAIIAEFDGSASDAQLESLARRLMTKKGKEKSFAKALKDITRDGNDEAMKALEKTLKKLSDSLTVRKNASP